MIFIHHILITQKEFYMKNSLTKYAITLLVASSLYAADKSQNNFIKYYYDSDFSKAIPAIEADIKLNQNRLAQCIGAEALKSKNIPQLAHALKLFVKSDRNYQKGNPKDLVAVSCEGFGDTVMLCSFLEALNKDRAKQGLPPATVHLDGIQQLLKPMMERSVPSAAFTTGQLDRQGKEIIPLIGIINPERIFQPKGTYLQAKEDVVNHWKKKIDTNRLNVATAWRSSDKPVLGGRMLYRDLPLKTIIDIARLADPKAHVYLVQGPPHHNIVVQSDFDKMSAEDQQKNHYNVIPEAYRQYVTQVALADGQEPNGAFEDTLALLKLCIYVGSDTVVPHMSGHVDNGQAIMILPPKSDDGTSQRDWRWATSDQDKSQGEVTHWYPANKLRLFEVNYNNMQELAPVVALLKQWHTARQACQS